MLDLPSAGHRILSIGGAPEFTAPMTPKAPGDQDPAAGEQAHIWRQNAILADVELRFADAAVTNPPPLPAQERRGQPSDRNLPNEHSSIPRALMA